MGQTHAGIADVELRCVYANRNPAAARIAVVAGESALAALVHLAVFRQGQGMGWNDEALLHEFSKTLCTVRH